MGDKANASSSASSSKGTHENPNVARCLSKYPKKGSKRPFVDPKMKELIMDNFKMVLGKLGNITNIITSHNKELARDNAKQPMHIVEALHDANITFKKLEDKKFLETFQKK